MSKRIITIILVSLISLTCAFGSFASEIATSSNAQLNIATSSNAMPLDDFMESDGFDMLDVPVFMSSGDLPSVSNTVDFSSVQLTMYYYDMSNNVKSVHAGFNGSGYASIARPSDYARLSFIRFRLYRNSLPPSGIYDVSVNFASNTGVTYTGAAIYSLKKTANASSDSSYINVGFTQSSGDFYISNVVDLGNVYELAFDMRSNDLVPPYGGYVKINFTKTTAQPDYTTAGGSYTSDNATHDIANNTAQQVEQGDTIIELIKNTIQTISSQLTAFWNQLAGEFTNLYNKMTQQHSEQLQADRDNTDDIIAAEESNTTDIINNDNRNTDTVVNGYDSSNLDESGNKLNDKLQEYESAESNIHDTASGWLSDYTMPDFDNFLNTGGILSACIWLGGFWQTVFVNMGAFNIPVTLSLTLVFVLMLVGYHRFRR
ncbi:hypothetical protein DWX59_13700 [Enterocloster aldenensis]|uniref:hypothetical protein n=1 Tax=Enterocloster aldenensis TaxID=358742 RepID=UPI000E4186B8|nr:hypothetical protein DWX59_13700 [Enterocloster aldenensis]